MMESVLCALDRPPVPNISGVNFDGVKITINGSVASGFDSIHVVLLSDFTASLGYINDYGNDKGEGPAINYASKSFPIRFNPSMQSRERYFVAVATSKINADNVRVFSGWKVYIDTTTGMPLSISTSSGNDGENLLYRARRINENNSKEVVYDLTFSLPKRRASECKLILKHNGIPKLNINDLSNIPNVKTDIKEALADTTGAGSGKLHIKSETPDFYLYRFYGYLEADSNDSIDVILIDTAGLVMDTLKSPVGISEDIGHMNIISTIYALTAMPSGTTDPLNTDSIATLPDSAKLKLLITAMVDLSLAHNSPQPDENEQSQGIFTNYMQFMDNVVGKWDSIGSASEGINRLERINDIILKANRNNIIDPVFVSSRGTLLEYGNNESNQKRKNYAFYNSYSRLHFDLNRPVYGSAKTGVGVMVRISPNVAVYKADFSNEANIFDTAFLCGDTNSRRIIIPSNDTLLDRILKDGIWIKGVGEPEEASYYTGVTSMRLPIQLSGSVVISKPFFISGEKLTIGDNEGTLLSRIERSVIKMHVLKPNAQGGVDTLYNVEKPHVLLHGQKRIVEVDTNFCRGVLEFFEQGTPEQLANIDITTINRYKVLLEDKATGNYRFLVVISAFLGKTTSDENVPSLISEEKFTTSKLGFRDIENSSYEVITVEDSVVEVAIEQDTSKWILPQDRSGKVVVDVTNCPKMKIYKNYISTSSPGNEVLDASMAKNGKVEMEWEDYENNYLRQSEGGPVLDKLTIVSTEGGFEQLAIRIENTGTPVEEFIRITRIKAKKIEYIQDGEVIEFGRIFMDKQKDGKGDWIERPVEIKVEFETNGRKPVPTISQIKKYYDVNLSFYTAGNKFEDPMYTVGVKPPGLRPVKLCSDFELWGEGIRKNALSYEVKQSNSTAGEYKVWSEITVTPRSYADATINTANSTFSMDVVTPDRGFGGKNSGTIDGDFFDNRLRAFGICRYIERNGYRKVIGADQEYGTTPATYNFSFGSDSYPSNSYVFYGGVILLSLNAGGKEHAWSRLVYPKQAEEFFQSGHGLGSQGAGLIYDNSDYGLFALRTDMPEVEHMDGMMNASEVLRTYWGSPTSKLNLLILNSCYNGNVTIVNNEYPGSSKVWNDLETEYITDPQNDGRGNNIFKWFESMGKRGAVCGWGQSTIYDADGNYEMYGRRKVINKFSNDIFAKGQGPADRQERMIGDKKTMDWFTKDVIVEFKDLRRSSDDGSQIAKKWVDAVATVVNNYRFRNHSNTFNATAIGVDKSVSPDICRVYALEVDLVGSEYKAISKEISVCTVP